MSTTIILSLIALGAGVLAGLWEAIRRNDPFDRWGIGIPFLFIIEAFFFIVAFVQHQNDPALVRFGWCVGTLFLGGLIYCIGFAVALAISLRKELFRKEVKQ